MNLMNTLLVHATQNERKWILADEDVVDDEMAGSNLGIKMHNDDLSPRTMERITQLIPIIVKRDPSAVASFMNPCPH